MKKSLLAVAVAAALPVVAQAQVTLFGVFDLGYRDNGTTTTMASGQWAGPRVGVRGSNDIGGGLKANFHVESAIGYLGSATWDTSRGAFAGLSGGFGRVDLGSRILSPSFWAAAAIDPTGQSGLNITPYGGIGARIDKAAYYTSNSLSGLIVRAATVLSDDSSTGKSGFDASAVYRAGPLTVAAAFGDNGTKDGMSLGLAYNLKVATVRVRFVDSELNNADAVLVGASIPFGKVTGYVDFLKDNRTQKEDQTLFAASYDLGKNTALYGYHKSIDKPGAKDTIGFGVRHSF